MSVSATPSTYYLRAVTCLSAFRVLVYLCRLEKVTKIKISKKDWEDLRVREVAYAWTKQIRTFMLFRVVVYGMGSLLQSRGERNILAVVSFGIDVLLLCVLVYSYWLKSTRGQRSVFVHERPLIPTLIQTMHLVAFFIAAFLEFQDAPDFGYFSRTHDAHDTFVYDT
mmetsp:Transcript_87/g.167  ORF Transcript_87/g.167 Transcript_87/m.167 type:complete len:167 (+) Transcript_87:44-544(+)